MIRNQKSKSYFQLIIFIILDSFSKKLKKKSPNNFVDGFTRYSVDFVRRNIEATSSLRLILKNENSTVAQIQDIRENGRHFIVDINERNCTCLKFQNMKMLCSPR